MSGPISLSVKTEFLVQATGRIISLYHYRQRLRFSSGLLLDIHRDVLGYEPEHAGKFRDARYEIHTSGATFSAAPAHLVRLRVNDLCTWLNDQKKIRNEFRRVVTSRIARYQNQSSEKKRLLYVLFLAAKAHHTFVQIHPFPGGNGRMARLIVSIILKNEGFSEPSFPPMLNQVILERRDEYLTCLHKADSGELLYFVKFLSEVLVESYKRTTEQVRKVVQKG